MLRAGVLVSGGGTNLQALIDQLGTGYITNCEIAVVLSGKENTGALKRAAQNDIPAEVCCRRDYATIPAYDKAMIEIFERYHVDFIIMAGYLSIVGEDFVSSYKNKIINIHPSLIPAFCGKGYYGIIPHRKALEYGVKVVGATVHFVTLEADSGPIILQKAVNVRPGDTPEILQQRVMEEAEWEILPEAVKLFCEGKLKVDGSHVYIEE